MISAGKFERGVQTGFPGKFCQTDFALISPPKNKNKIERCPLFSLYHKNNKKGYELLLYLYPFLFRLLD